jgi:diguanylate cyclase (GGDEF)-like protein
VHVLAVSGLIGGNLLTSTVADDVMRALTTMWNLIAVMYLSTRMTARLVASYTVVVAMTVAAMLAPLPGTAPAIAFRVVLGAGLIAMSMTSFLLLRGELEKATQAAHAMATSDTLTGLSNRRGMFEAFPRIAGDSHRRSGMVAILICDLDRFKRVNDTMGHSAGDELLRQVGDTLRGTTRAEDLLVRLGGEELAVIASVAEPAEARALAERIRVAVERDCGRWQATVSIGVSTARPPGAGEQSRALEQLISTADQRLYQAKSAGRNRVVGPLPAATDDVGESLAVVT